MKILLVDDEVRVRQLLRFYFERDGYAVEEASEGLGALAKASQNNYDMIVLDVMLPGLDGLEVCSLIKKRKPTPILLLTAKGEERDRLDGFEAGADDYVVKPFSPREVACRVKAIVSRSSARTYFTLQMNSSNTIVFPHLIIEHEGHRVLADGQKINFTLKEYELLHYLAAHARKVFTREALFGEIWKYEPQGDYRTVDTHIKRIREKLNAASPEAASLIRTIWGVGYCFIENEAYVGEYHPKPTYLYQ